MRFSFPARIEGVFEVELEGRKRADRRAEGQPRMRTRWAAAAVAVAVGALAAPAPAAAHGLVGRADLPIPEWLFGWAAAVVLIVSFAALALLWQEPRLEGRDPFRPLPEGLSFALVNTATEVFAGLVGVGLLALTVYAGLEGVQSPQANFAPTFIYVIFWVGLVPASILFGDVFRAFNPWRAIARGAGWLASRVGGPLPAPFRYPDWLGRWPAVVGLLGLRLDRAGLHERRRPQHARDRRAGLHRDHAGRDRLLRHRGVDRARGGLLGLLQPVLAHLAGRGARRPARAAPAAGARSRASTRCPGTIALLVVMIGTVAFDGASEGQPWTDIAPDIQDFFTSIGFSLGTALELTFTVGMLIGLALVAAVYLLGIVGVRTVDRRPFGEIARSYVHTLVPIAAVYVIAHYFSLLAYNGQAIAYLASDPLGEGSDLFGTADATIDYGVIGATAIWYVQVGVLVAGPRLRARAGARPRAGHVREGARRDDVPVLDARGDGRLHDRGPVPPVPGEPVNIERLSCSHTPATCSSTCSRSRLCSC